MQLPPGSAAPCERPRAEASPVASILSETEGISPIQNVRHHETHSHNCQVGSLHPSRMVDMSICSRASMDFLEFFSSTS
eukprot:6487109-Amphidinium_carterae.1